MQLFVIPSYTTLRDANEAKDEDLLMVGAQNMGWEEQGQFTGEISPLMLQEVGTRREKAGKGSGETGQDRGKTGSEETAGACEESCPGSPHRSMVLSPQQDTRG